MKIKPNPYNFDLIRLGYDYYLQECSKLEEPDFNLLFDDGSKIRECTYREFAANTLLEIKGYEIFYIKAKNYILKTKLNILIE